MGWEGVASGQLQAVVDELDASANKTTIGVTQVTKGERRRGWKGKTCEVFFDPTGVTVQESGRKGEHNVPIPIQVQIRKRSPTTSDDKEVMESLEKAADVLRAKPTLGGARRNRVTGMRVLPIPEGGEWETVGLLTVEYLHTVEDRQ